MTVGRPAFLIGVGAALASLLAAPLAPPVAQGQTIPLRPTPTAEPGAFSVLAQPTPPVPPTVAAGAPPTASPPAPRASAAAATAAPSPVPPAEPTEAASPPLVGVIPTEPFRVEHVSASSVAPLAPPVGWRAGETLLRVVGAPPAGEAGSVTVVPSSRDLAAAGGQAARLAVFGRDPGGSWRPVIGQSVDGAAGRISFRPAAPGLFAVLARAVLPVDADYAIPGGRFYRWGQEGGFGVVDGLGGARSAFFTVYAAVGGEAALGRPISRRFVAGTQLVQAFERGVIVSDSGGAATARAGAPAIPIPSGASDPEPLPLPA